MVASRPHAARGSCRGVRSLPLAPAAPVPNLTEAGEKPFEINGRGDRIRTCDIYVPNGAPSAHAFRRPTARADEVIQAVRKSYVNVRHLSSTCARSGGRHCDCRCLSPDRPPQVLGLLARLTD
jgi:hypothetical protein